MRVFFVGSVSKFYQVSRDFRTFALGVRVSVYLLDNLCPSRVSRGDSFYSGPIMAIGVVYSDYYLLLSHVRDFKRVFKSKFYKTMFLVVRGYSQVVLLSFLDVVYACSMVSYNRRGCHYAYRGYGRYPTRRLFLPTSSLSNFRDAHESCHGYFW